MEEVAKLEKKVHDESQPPAYPPTQPMVYTSEQPNNNAQGTIRPIKM